MGIFDEGCMGMYNAIIDDELLNPAGIYKERLSQSALVAKMRTVKDAEARGVYDWLVVKGVKFAFGKDAATELTLEQVLEQCKMYIAAVRIAKEYGCDAIGIQYQQGLKDMARRVGPGRRNAEQCRAASGVCRGGRGRVVCGRAGGALQRSG